jgi:hypothetical protein
MLKCPFFWEGFGPACCRTRTMLARAVIDENVLDLEVGSPKITHDAWLNVAELSWLPNVTVRWVLDSC